MTISFSLSTAGWVANTMFNIYSSDKYSLRSLVANWPVESSQKYPNIRLRGLAINLTKTNIVRDAKYINLEDPVITGVKNFFQFAMDHVGIEPEVVARAHVEASTIIPVDAEPLYTVFHPVLGGEGTQVLYNALVNSTNAEYIQVVRQYFAPILPPV